MADSKVSGLPVATLPFTGTEQVMVTQGGESRRVAATSFAAPALHNGYRNDRFYAPNEGPLALSQSNANQIFFVPLILPVAASVKTLMLIVNGSNISGAQAYVGIYASANGNPGALIAGSSAIDVSTGTGKTFTFTTAVNLQPGAYWMATLANMGGVAFQGQAYSTSYGFYAMGMSSEYGVPSQQTSSVYASAPFTSGLPSVAPGTATQNSAASPTVYFKVS